MTEAHRRVHCSALLTQLETQLKAAQLWASTAPAESRLQSSLPFSVDQLSLEEWLQFIFLPKMRVMLEREMTLPIGSGLTSYAEVAWRDHLARRAPLLAVLRDLDRLLGGELSSSGSH